MQHAYSNGNMVAYLGYIATCYHLGLGETEAGSVDESIETSIILNLDLGRNAICRDYSGGFFNSRYGVVGNSQSEDAQRPVCCTSCGCV